MKKPYKKPMVLSTPFCIVMGLPGENCVGRLDTTLFFNPDFGDPDPEFCMPSCYAGDSHPFREGCMDSNLNTSVS